MSYNTEWLIEFNDNSYFRISETQFYKEVQTNKTLKKTKQNENRNIDRGMCEMDFCYLNESSIDLIECKEVSSNKQSLKEKCVDKALHSVCFLKTALYSKNSSIYEKLKGRNYDTSVELRLYFIFNIGNKDKSFILDIANIIESNIRKFVLFPLGKMWNIKVVEVLDYDTAKKKLKYIK